MGERTTEFLEITKCSSKFEDGTTCYCRFCNGGVGVGVTQTHRSLGFELKCNNNLVSEECTPVDSGSIEYVAAARKNGDVGSPNQPVVSLPRLLVEADDNSPASFQTGAAVAGIVVILF